MIDAKTVARIARLARISVSEEEKTLFARELSNILQWVEQLGEVKTDGVPQMVSVADMQLPWRDDKVTDGNQQDAVLQNAPKAEYGCFEVPKVME